MRFGRVLIDFRLKYAIILANVIKRLYERISRRLTIQLRRAPWTFFQQHQNIWHFNAFAVSLSLAVITDLLIHLNAYTAQQKNREPQWRKQTHFKCSPRKSSLIAIYLNKYYYFESSIQLIYLLSFQAHRKSCMCLQWPYTGEFIESANFCYFDCFAESKSCLISIGKCCFARIIR